MLAPDELRGTDGEQQKIHAPLDPAVTALVRLSSVSRVFTNILFPFQILHVTGHYIGRSDDGLVFSPLCLCSCLLMLQVLMQVLEPLHMACSMDVPRIAEPALSCLHKLACSQSHVIGSIEQMCFIPRMAFLDALNLLKHFGVSMHRWLMHTCMLKAARLDAWTMVASLHKCAPSNHIFSMRQLVAFLQCIWISMHAFGTCIQQIVRDIDWCRNLPAGLCNGSQ